ncbi:hypothetical protein BFW87_24660 [Pseudomonas fluorescens]|uniref:Uncharacterized protein n=1 Tax=Pseudomonas fluorescens TaxID=294 RepID=A0A1T2Y2T1_PSEFL|nr:hypothetical protein [Pseudomonas fluorescens]OPA86451.1 hypothetical protein BFW87_24660 [Pseudomonas fluorescens]
MIDSVTGKLVVLFNDDEFGPYIRLRCYEDAMGLEELFDGVYHIPYWTRKTKELLESGGNEYYFGCAVDVAKLQAILDSIDLS